MKSLLTQISFGFFKDASRWPLWAPVFLGLGIVIYFSLPHEPSAGWAWGSLLFFTIALCSFRLHVLRLFIFSASLVALGFSVSFFRTQRLATPMLHCTLLPLEVEGVVTQVELKPLKKGGFYQRLTLEEIQIPHLDNLPRKIRLTLKGDHQRLWPGQKIRIKAKLSPIEEAMIPGEFNFRRQSYFQGLGATGFSLSSPQVIGEAISWTTRVERRREEITAFFLTHMSFPEGAIAAALITGDKVAIPEAIREEFIRSGLAHILAISGLHLTIIAGVVFMITRRCLSLIPPLCLFYNSKKIAAVGAILLSLAYLIISGFGVPAQRAFIMITLAMGAILIDRTALSMRTVAWAAFIILVITPEALLGPSFQLSFAAVIGLISGYEQGRIPFIRWGAQGGIVRKFTLYIGGLVFTSLLATFATLPLTVYIFHRFSVHAMMANLIAVPLTTFVIMPSAFLECLLAPFGLGDSVLWVLEKSIYLLRHIASTISSWPGSNVSIPQPSFLSFSLVILGGLWLCLWQQSWRKWGFLCIGAGSILAFYLNSPHVLIDGRGKLVGCYKPPVLWLTSLRRGKFTADIWAKSLGTSKTELLPCKDGVCETVVEGVPVVVSSVKENQPCVEDALLIRLEPSQNACPQARLIIDRYDLWRGGGHALWISPHHIHVEKVRSAGRNRPWTKQAVSCKSLISSF